MHNFYQINWSLGWNWQTALSRIQIEILELIYKLKKKINMNTSETLSQVAYFTEIDYGVLIVILSLSLAIGIYFGFFSDNVKTAEDYLVGGHKMKTLPIAISLVARYIVCGCGCTHWIKFMGNYTFVFFQSTVSNFDNCNSIRDLFIWLAILSAHPNIAFHHHLRQLLIFASVLSQQHW